MPAYWHARITRRVRHQAVTLRSLSAACQP
jgi:hypothetical protein